MSAMWLSLITLAHFTTSACMKAANCGCVITSGVAPCFSHAALMSGRCRIAAIVRLSRSTIGCGVSLGAMKPTHSVAWKPGTPASASVGTSGRMGERAHHAGLDLGRHGRDGIEQKLDLSAENVAARAGRSLVGHVHDVDPGEV